MNCGQVQPKIADYSVGSAARWGDAAGRGAPRRLRGLRARVARTAGGAGTGGAAWLARAATAPLEWRLQPDHGRGRARAALGVAAAAGRSGPVGRRRGDRAWLPPRWSSLCHSRGSARSRPRRIRSSRHRRSRSSSTRCWRAWSRLPMMSRWRRMRRLVNHSRRQHPPGSVARDEGYSVAGYRRRGACCSAAPWAGASAPAAPARRSGSSAAG